MNPSKYFGITDCQSLVLLGEFGNEAEARLSDEARSYRLAAVFNEEMAEDTLRRIHEFMRLDPVTDGFEWYVMVDWTGKAWLLDEFPSWQDAKNAVDVGYGDCAAVLGKQQQWAWRRMLLAVLEMAIMSPELMGDDAPPKRGRKGKKGPRQLSLH